MRKVKNHNLGFTLIELLIVIAIISILAGAVLLLVNPAEIMRRGRNNRRLQDLDTINKALTLALSSEKIVLTNTKDSNCISCSSTYTNPNNNANGIDGWIKFTVLKDNGLKDFIGILPSPLTDNTNDIYYFLDNGEKYEINAYLENDGSGNDRGSLIMKLDGGNNENLYELGTSPALDIL